MNEQNSDSFLGDVPSTPPEAITIPSPAPKERKGILDTLAFFWHKNPPESSLAKEKISDVPMISEATPIIDGTLPVGDVSQELLVSTSIPQIGARSIIDRVTNIFHKHTPAPGNNESPQVTETLPITPEGQVTTEVPVDTLRSDPEEIDLTDDRFARLLNEDVTYHSMLRSEDIRHIQFQLSMRYMLVMLAIFVVIAWVVNNRIIMFSFSDVPLLSRVRDALFALLTGLFALTVWFGSAVWFGDRLSIVLLRILSVGLFVVVLVSIYLPFWR